MSEHRQISAEEIARMYAIPSYIVEPPKPPVPLRRRDEALIALAVVAGFAHGYLVRLAAWAGRGIHR